MKKTLLFLGLLASTSQAAIVYDLAADFSNASNPNGVWSFTQGNTLLSHFAAPADPNNLNLAVTNGIWAPGSGSFGTSVFKMTGGSGLTTGYNANDFQAGDVIVHGTNPGAGGDLFIRWTAPQAGTIAYNGGVWYAHSLVVRSQDFFVNFNGGANLHTGTVTPVQNRSNIQNFAGGLSVNAGDVLAIRLAPTAGQTFASLSGVNFTVELEPTPSGVPEPSTLALTGGALLLAAFRLRRQ